MFIGYWNKSVILTYVGMLFSVLGISLSIRGYFSFSMCCMVVSGICDLFDGRIARRCKRTEEEKLFGVQIDSLVDVIAFIMFPVVFSLSLGYTGIYAIVIYGFFSICGIARLGFFNVNCDENAPVPYYRGLPVTYNALIFPLIFGVRYIINSNIFPIIYLIAMILIGFLNISDIKFNKPKGKMYIFFSVIAIFLIVAFLILGFKNTGE